MKPIFFRTPSAFGDWLEEHHEEANELWVGYYKKDSGRRSITWPESVDEALCFGWIDGIRKSINDISYKIRFTPRNPGSIWSAVNIKRAEALIEQGRMQPTGIKAYQNRRENRSGIYSYEQRKAELEEPYNELLKNNRAAWEFFRSQSPSYRKAISWWIISARKEETRQRRLEKLISYSSQGEKIPEMNPGRSSREMKKST